VKDSYLGAVRFSRECFALLDCHVIVSSRTQTVTSMQTLIAGRPVEESVAESAGEQGVDAAQSVAFRRLAESQLDASYRLASAILGDPTEAQDAVHDAFVTAWRKWGSLRDHSRFEPWFQRILVNTCRNRLRRASRLSTSEFPAEVVRPAADETAAVHDRDVLDRGFERLSADDRVVLILRYYRDMKVDDIAELIGVRPGTVMSRLHRAQGRLRAALEASDVEGLQR